jgi:galactokinase
LTGSCKSGRESLPARNSHDKFQPRNAQLAMPAPESQAVLELFKQHFGYRPAHVTRAPAKIEVLGSHCDYNEGLLLTAAVDRYAFVAASPRTDGKIELIHADRAPEVFWITEPRANAAAPWADPLKAVLRELRQRKVHFSGFNAALHNDIPPGLGLGDEAAAVVAVALMVRKLFPFSLSDSGSTIPPRRDERGHLPPLPAAERLHFARVCRAALTAAGRGDDGFIAALTSLAGKPWNLLSHDCRFGSLEHIPLVGTALIACDSGVRVADAGLAASEIREHCLGAARQLKARALRSVEPTLLRASKAALAEREYACAAHVVGEIQLVAAAERALRAEDHRQFGNYVSLSHESAGEHLKTSCPEVDVLVELARAHAGCFGARALAGSGATINVVAYHAAEPFMAEIARGYEAKTGRKIKPLVCQIVDGAA